MSNTNVQIREMARRDIPAGERLCRASGWNQLESDWRLFLEGNPEGCRVAELNGEVTGTVTILPYQDRFNWLAMVLVDPEKRRMGIGTRLLEEALSLAGGTCVRLDATDAGREIYKRYEFVDEYAINRMICRHFDARSISPSPQARRVCEHDFAEILELDRVVFGADREFVLRTLFNRAPECGWIVRDSELKGYCFGRDGFLYQHLGPIVAEDVRVAQMLLTCCLCAGDGGPYVIDAFDHSAVWLDSLRMIGFTKERWFTRMFRGQKKYTDDSTRIYAAAGPELG